MESVFYTPWAHILIFFFINIFPIADQEARIYSGRCNKPRMPSCDNLWGFAVQPLPRSGCGLRPTRAESPSATEERCGGKGPVINYVEWGLQHGGGGPVLPLKKVGGGGSFSH